MQSSPNYTIAVVQYTSRALPRPAPFPGACVQSCCKETRPVRLVMSHTPKEETCAAERHRNG
jgi:hypothetical protein